MTPVRAVIIDDTDDLRMLLNLALETHGFDVVGEAGDGRAGIELVQETHPDLVMLDLAMPVMDGLEALPAIRRICPDARIVVLSAFGADQMSRRALSAGADGYIQKGSSIRTIVDYLTQLTSGGNPPPSVGLPTPRQSAGRSVAASHNGVSRSDRKAAPIPATPQLALDHSPFGVLELVDLDEARVRSSNTVAQQLLQNPLVPGTALAQVSEVLAAEVSAHGVEGDPTFGLRLGEAHVRVSVRQVGSTVYVYLAPASDDAGLLRRAIASTAHELRGPVSVIRGVEEMVNGSDDMAPAQRRQLLESVARQARMLDSLTADLLTAAQIEGGTLRVNLQEVDPREVIESIVGDRADVTVHATQEHRVRADPLRLEQMIDNLLSNARKYADPPYEIRIGAQDSHVQIAVHDRGEGVPVGFRDHLFQEFSRAPGTTAAGTGMGLFVVRTLAEVQHGSVDYSPRADGGSVFTITLPRTAPGG